MRILNIGSINCDHVYRVNRIVRPGETLASAAYARFAGGKGFNQSVALARAGARVAHVGRVGPDGAWLRDLLEKEGVDVTALTVGETPTGHAMIQVAGDGQNAIVIHAGANGELDGTAVAAAIAGAGPGDRVLLQNETNAVAEAIPIAAARGLKVVFNPAPMTVALSAAPLGLVDVLILNETEAEALVGAAPPEDTVAALRVRYPETTVVLTLGAEGVLADDNGERVRRPATPARVLDTTAAGDTFVGYFLAARAAGVEITRALDWACRAAALCVSRPGAAASIPRRDEVGEP